PGSRSNGYASALLPRRGDGALTGPIALSGRHREALARGFYLSFAGTVTYPTAHGVIGAASIIPLDHMLVETDSPFLPPQSRRGQPNAPRYLVETVERIAALRGTTTAEIAQRTRQNTIELFRLNHAG